MTNPTADPTRTDTVAITSHTAASLRELLSMCEEFLRTAGPLVHAELRTYLAHQAPPADTSWFIDMLGFSSVHLGHLLPASAAPPSQTWQRHDDHDHLDQQAWA